MYASPALVAEYDRLTQALTDVGLDLPASIQRLDTAATLAVPSLLGWNLTMFVNGSPVTLTSVQPWAQAADIRASLRMPISILVTNQTYGGLVFYAAAPHAFTRLAVNLICGVGPARRHLRVDQDLNPDLTPGLSGLRNLTSINHAIRALIEDGETPQAARHHLHSNATSANISLTETAERLLTQHRRAVRALALGSTLSTADYSGIVPVVTRSPRLLADSPWGSGNSNGAGDDDPIWETHPSRGQTS